MLIQIPSFNGFSPRSDAENLPPTAAQDALDCNFSSGAVTGLRTHEVLNLPTLTDGQAIKSGFTWGYTDDENGQSYWQAWAWPYDTDAIRSPVQRDKHNRFYWTGRKPDGSTEFRYSAVANPKLNWTHGEPTSSYQMGVINSTYWDYTVSSIFVSFDKTKALGFPLSSSQIESMETKIYAVGKDGDLTKGKRIPSSAEQTGGFTLDADPASVVNGNAMRYNLTIPGAVDSYASQVVGAVEYKSYTAKVTIPNTNWGVCDARVWYITDPTKPEYIVITAGAPGYPTTYDQTVSDSLGSEGGSGSVGGGVGAGGSE